jgi:acetyltransferase
VVEECGKAGADGAVIVSAGFRETGREGKELEDRIDEARRRYGVRIVGPNCVGFIRPSIGLTATIIKAEAEPRKIAFFSTAARWQRDTDWAVEAHIGFSMLVSLASMLDVDFGDLIDLLGDDPATKSILIYMEGVGQAGKFMSAARGFARNKPVIILKPGRHDEAARAALSHTGAMTGDDEVYDAAFKRVGVVRVAGIDDLFNASSVLDSRHVPKGPRVVIVTNAGGPGAITTDRLVGNGGRLAALSGETMQKLNALLPPYWSGGNPVDVLGDADLARYSEA